MLLAHVGRNGAGEGVTLDAAAHSPNPRIDLLQIAAALADAIAQHTLLAAPLPAYTFDLGEQLADLIIGHEDRVSAGRSNLPPRLARSFLACARLLALAGRTIRP